MGRNQNVEIVCEIGINHNGDLDIAKKLIDVAWASGCDYVKFQKRNIKSVYTPEELASPRESPWGKTFEDQKERLEFGYRGYKEIDHYCRQKNFPWFASVWDIYSFDFIYEFGVPFIKIPSPLLTKVDLLRKAEKSKIPIILSTGMSTMDMIDDAVDIIGKERIYCIMQCTSTYPSSAEEQNLRCILTLKEKYPWTKIGFSNHSPGIIYIPIAVALGAEMIEMHITLDRAMYGSDQAASVEPEGVFKIVKYTNKVQKAVGNGVKRIFDSEVPIMQKLRR